MPEAEYRIERYTAQREKEWNSYVAQAKNATFLFHRSYMDYHRDRFNDHSLMLWRGNTLYALLPANQVDDVLYSHQGLTYGGLLMNKRCSAVGIREVFSLINSYLAEQGFSRVVYKALPWIYHQMPAEEDLYVLHTVCKAHILERDISSTIMLDSRTTFAESRKSGLRKALRCSLHVEESNDFAAFWQILTDNLMRKHGVRPVHSLQEIMLLHQLFPDNIRLFMSFDGQRPLAGTVLYLTPEVVHTQYISATEEGKADGAVDILFHHLLHERKWKAKYLDFGKSTESTSDQLNEHLIFQKEGFGGRAVCYDTYEWTL